MSSPTRTTKGDGALLPLPIAARRHLLVREVDRQLAAAGLRITDKVGPSSEGLVVESVVIAVSGGPDSVALLLASVALQSRKRRESARLSVIVAHVHHHLRDSAEGDARFVSDLCSRVGVPCVIKHVHPRTESGNISASARKLRYQALAEVAAESNARCVLVGHHADDQLETVLMALCRGAGPKGLAGMKPATRLAGIEVIRPLLGVGKDACMEFCRAAGVVWREDPSNQDLSRRRARLRRDVIPVLDELWPGVARRAARNARLIRGSAQPTRRENGSPPEAREPGCGRCD